MNSKRWHLMRPQEFYSWVSQEMAQHKDLVFDCDGTLLKGDVGILGAWGLLRSGLVDPNRVPEEWRPENVLQLSFAGFKQLREHLASYMGHEEIFDMESRLLSGFPEDVARSIVQESVQEGVQKGFVEYLNPIQELISERAEDSIIVSGSPKLCVDVVGATIGLDLKNVYATQLNLVDGHFREDFTDDGVVWAENKRKLLLSKGYKRVSMVAGDSTGDWPMMQLAEHLVWCVLWPPQKNPWATLREQLEMTLEKDLLPLPVHEGIYVAEDTRSSNPKYWVLEIRA